MDSSRSLRVSKARSILYNTTTRAQLRCLGSGSSGQLFRSEINTMVL